MNNLETLTFLLQTLSDCNDTSQDALKILSVDLNTSVLDDLNMVYEQQAEGISLDLSEQDIKIFKGSIRIKCRKSAILIKRTKKIGGQYDANQAI